MVRTRSGKIAALATALVLASLLALLLIPAVGRIVDNKTEQFLITLKNKVFEMTGLELSYDTLAFLPDSRIQATGIRLAWPGASPQTSPGVAAGSSPGAAQERLPAPDTASLSNVLSIESLVLRMDIMSALRGKFDRTVRELHLEGARIHIVLPRDKALFDRLSALLGQGAIPTDKGAAAASALVPPLILSMKDTQIQVVTPDIPSARFAIPDLSFSSLSGISEYDLKNASYKVLLPAAAQKKAKSDSLAGEFSLSGTASSNLSVLSATLAASLSSPQISLATQTFALRYENNRIRLDRMMDDGLGFWASYDTARGEGEGGAAFQSVRARDIVNMEGLDSTLDEIKNLRITGAIQGRVHKDMSLSYSGRLKTQAEQGQRVQGLQVGGLSVETSFSGDQHRMAELWAHVKKGDWEGGYKGSIDYEGAALSGALWAGRGEDGGSATILGRDGSYALDAEGALRFGGARLRDVHLSAMILSGAIELSGAGKLGSESGEGGSWTTRARIATGPSRSTAGAARSNDARSNDAASGIAAALDFEDIPVDMGLEVARVLGLQTLPELPRGGIAGAAITAQSRDYKDWQWTASALSLRLPLGTMALELEASGTGDLKAADIRQALLRYGGQEITLAGLVSYGQALAFDGRLGYGGESYALKASYAAGTLLYNGSYGLEGSLRALPSGGYAFSVGARDLPIPYAAIQNQAAARDAVPHAAVTNDKAARLVASIQAEGSYKNEGEWHLRLDSFEARYQGAAPEPQRAIPAISGRADIVPGSITFDALTIAGLVDGQAYSLSGPLLIRYKDFQNPEPVVITGTMRGGGLLGLDRAVYTIDATYARRHVDIGLRVASLPLDIAGLAGFWTDASLAVSGAFDPRALLAGQLPDWSLWKGQLSAGLSGPELRVPPQRFTLRYEKDIVYLDRSMDDGLALALRIDTRSGEIGAQAQLSHVRASQLVSLNRPSPDDFVHSLLALPLDGTIQASRAHNGALHYKAALSARGGAAQRAGRLSLDGIEASIQCEGDEKSFAQTIITLNRGSWGFSYEGQLVFAGLGIHGSIWLGHGAENGRALVDGRDGRYTLAAEDPVRFGRSWLRALHASFQKNGDVISVHCDGSIGREGAPEGSILVRAELQGSRALTASIESQGFSVDAAMEIAQAVGMPGLAGMSDMARLPAGGMLRLKATGQTRDYRNIAWTLRDAMLTVPLAGSLASLELRATGTQEGAQIEQAVFQYKEQDIRLSGAISFGKNLGFGGTLRYAGQDYDIHAAYEGQSLLLTGSYGLTGEIRRLDGPGPDAGSSVASGTGSARGYAVLLAVKDLPLVLGKDKFALTLVASGEYRNERDWQLLFNSFEGKYLGSLQGLPSLSGQAELRPGQLRFSTLTLNGVVSGKPYSLSGPIQLDFSGLGLSGAQLALSGQLSGNLTANEAYTLSLGYENGRLSGMVKLQGFPVDRLTDLPLRGELEGSVAIDGPLDLQHLNMAKAVDLIPSIQFDLQLVNGEYRAMPISCGAAGDFDAGLVRISRFSAVYMGHFLQDVRATVDIAHKKYQLSGSYRGSIAGIPVRAVVDATGASESENDFLPLKFDGTVETLAISETIISDWRFSGEGLHERVNISGGEGSVVASYGKDGNFTLALAKPFPLQARATGRVMGSFIDAHIDGLDIDLAAFESMLTTPAFALRKGRVGGSLDISGPMSDPDITGTLLSSGTELVVKEFVKGVAGPFDFPVRFSGRTVEFGPSAIALGGGAFTIAASSALDHWGLTDIALKVNSKESSTIDLDGKYLGITVHEGKAQVSINMALQDNVYDINGSLTLLQGEVFVDPQGFLPDPNIRQNNADAILRIHATFGFGRAVQVYLPNKSIPVLNGTADPSSKLKMYYDSSNEDFSFDGKVTLRTGYILYYLRNFRVRSAEVIFAEEGQNFDPHVNVVAELRELYNNSPLLITLTAENQPLSNINPHLSSRPAMNDAQLLAAMSGGVLTSTQSSGGTLDVRGALISSSEFIPQLNLFRNFEFKVGQALGLDMLHLRSSFVQRFLLDISKPATAPATVAPLATWLDQTELFIGKYISENAFLRASFQLRDDPLVTFSHLRLDSEIGIDFDTPFGTLSWSLSPFGKESSLVSGQALSLGWKIFY